MASIFFPASTKTNTRVEPGSVVVCASNPRESSDLVPEVTSPGGLEGRRCLSLMLIGLVFVTILNLPMLCGANVL